MRERKIHSGWGIREASTGRAVLLLPLGKRLDLVLQRCGALTQTDGHGRMVTWEGLNCHRKDGKTLGATTVFDQSARKRARKINPATEASEGCVCVCVGMCVHKFVIVCVQSIRCELQLRGVF